MLAFLLTLFILPLGVMTYRYIQQATRAAVQDARHKTSIGYANGVVVDYMRQFSQDPYSGHYDTGTLNRSSLLYSNGFSTVTFIADRVKHSLYLDATGGVGSAAAPLAKRRVEAVIQFVSPLTKYGTMINGPFTISADNVVYSGGMWINGTLTVSGSPVTWNGGPLIVNGSVAQGSGAVLNGSLYYGGASKGALTVNGGAYNFVPKNTWPSIDQDFFNANSGYLSTVSRSIVFNSTDSFTVVNGPSFLIPSVGAILFCSGCNFTIHGVVSGRVTVVAAGPAGSTTKGNITVDDNLIYVGASSMSATSANSFAALATNKIYFKKSSGSMSVAGTYFVEQGTTNMALTGPGSSGARFQLNGARSQGMTVTGFPGGTVLSYDPGLLVYPPPGLPETPMLVNYRVR
ncbi:MAG: hypothetical protein PHU21_00350 [Elusimicrobia bacterium]|nr:hypothetical protein [Elusimicrobiota bacterium]